MTEADIQDIPPGIAMVHSNSMESLRNLFIDWVKNHPLPPFESETVLLQSNGIRQWLKLGLAETQHLGISTDTHFLLPSPFIWECYRAALPEYNITPKSALDRGPLTWRLYQMMPETFESDPILYEPLLRFLRHKQHPIKQYQLATQLADLFDQYQVHRADWLLDWSDLNSPNSNRIRFKSNEAASDEIPKDQQWQPALWRALIQELGQENWAASSRSTLHDALMQRIDEIAEGKRERPAALPRRIMVFGISSLPRQTLETLGHLGKICQLLFFVHNPCQYFWSNIIEGSDLLKSKRFAPKIENQLATPEALHLLGNPLLAAWGKQGRDFVRLLDDWDEVALSRELFQQRYNVFSDASGPKATLLQRVQSGILNLDPTPKPDEETTAITADESITFHIAHSPQREVEILHDQLLKLFDQKDGVASTIAPKDVIVMLPDIDLYAPHIEAVFGRQEPHDEGAPPLIPYSITDQKNRGHNPIYKAVETLLTLPGARFTASEVLDLLEVEALQNKFGLKPQDLPTLQRWIRDTGIRWGLDLEHRGYGRHRPPLDQALGLNQNTWEFGLNRLFLGYAIGDGEPLGGIAPYKDIGGIESRLLGSLQALIKALKETADELEKDAEPKIWRARFDALLMNFFDPKEQRDERTVAQLKKTLEDWAEDCDFETFHAEIPLIVAREAWSTQFDRPNLTQRFLSGSVHFCTLMPMRSIPFKVVCLLGMGAGNFPRQQPPRAFDLMQLKGVYRPGDRSRRDDDRYMFLEALLSAQERVLISWVGRSIRDNSTVEASVLVNQLRDHLEACWHLNGTPTGDRNKAGKALLDALTIEYPLQPFSQAYMEASESSEGRLFTYAHEWLPTGLPKDAPIEGQDLDLPLPNEIPTLSLRGLGQFLRNPSEHFFNRRLNVYFDWVESQIDDDENFVLDALQSYQLKARALDAVLKKDLDSPIKAALHRLRLEGQFPLAASGDIVSDEIQTIVQNVIQQEDQLKAGWGPVEREPRDLKPLRFTASRGDTLILEDWLRDLHPHPSDAKRFAIFKRTPSEIQKVKKDPRLDKALDLWVNQLAANASGLRAESYLIGSDAAIHIPCIEDPAIAHALLTEIVDAWLQGLTSPLPVAPQAAFAYLNADEAKREVQAKHEYDGTERTMGEAQKSAYLQRAFPTFEDLLKKEVAGKGFGPWTEALYAPLKNHIQPMGDDA